MSNPSNGNGRPSTGQVAGRNAARQLKRRILDEGVFGGGFDIPDDITPTEAAIEAFRRALAMVRWIESQMARWTPTLMDLGKEHWDDRGSVQVIPTHEAGWLELWMAERRELREAIKLCHTIGVEERQLAIQEQQADAMFTILERMIDALGLTEEQRRKVPQLMPEIIRTATQQTAGGVVHTPLL
jgi:hypothetical protein